MLHHYPRHVSSINMPIFRRKNRIYTASGIFALCKRLHSTLVKSGLSSFIQLSRSLHALRGNMCCTVDYKLSDKKKTIQPGKYVDNYVIEMCNKAKSNLRGYKKYFIRF